MRKGTYPKNAADVSLVEERILEALTAPSLLSEVERLTGLPRSTAEYNLRKLLKKKLVRTVSRGKRTCYAKTAARPSPRSVSAPIVALPGVTVYRGHDAVESVWKEITEKPAGMRLVGIQPHRSFREGIRKVPKDAVRKVSQALSDKRFIVDAIVHEDLAHSLFREYRGGEAKDVAKAFTGRLEDMVRVPPDFLDEKAEFFLIDNELFFIDWFEKFALKITDRNICDLILSIYYAVKAYGKRYEQSKYIESLITSSDGAPT